MAPDDSLPPEQRDILEAWKTAMSKNAAGDTFSIGAVDKREDIKNLTGEFLSDPDPGTFTEMWKTGYSAGQAVAPTPIPEKWAEKGRSIESLAELIDSIVTSDTYQPEWEDELSAPGSTREFFGWHHADTQPIVTADTRSALSFFGVPQREISRDDTFADQQDAYEAFRSLYEETVGHPTAGTSWEVPINVEIYALCICVNNSEKRLENETQEDFKRLYERIVEAKEASRSEDSDTNTEATGETSEFWHDIRSEQESAEAFLKDPSQEQFNDWLETFPWFVSRWADEKTEGIFAEMDGEAIGATFEDAKETGSIAPVLELPGFGMAAASLALAAIQPEIFIPLNKRATKTLDYLGYNPPKPNTTSESRYQDFNAIVDEFIDRYDLRQYLSDVPDWVTDYQVARYAFYQHNSESIDLAELLSIDVPEGTNEGDEQADLSAKVPDADFYWVNQNRNVELEGQFLRSQDQKWQRDVTVLEQGDIVFHYTDQAICACSVVTDEAYQTEMDGGEYYRVELNTTHLDQPLPLTEIRDTLQDPEVRHEKQRYPLDKNGNVIQAYLCHLTPEAGTYLLETGHVEVPRADAEKQYFWVNSKKTHWHEEGGEVFYSIDGRKNAEAYQSAQPGDQVLVYEISPEKQIVGQASVTQSKNEEASSGAETSDAGVRFRWDRSLDGPTWNEVKTDPALEDSRIVETNKSFVLTELSEEHYKRIVELSQISRFEDYTEELAVPASNITVEQQQLHFPDDQWDRIQTRIEQALANGNHVLLFGPPGTGKTKLARQVCEATVGAENHELVTASADWSTFDTVGGYQTTAKNTLTFEPGVVLDRFQRDTDQSPANEWLIIDELNRADIDKAFGSLFSALTGESVTLPFDGSDGDPIEILDASRRQAEVTDNRFFIPEDWRMLATMNTLDKTSLYEMSYAFMRRWAFIPVGIPDLPPKEDGDGAKLESLVAKYVGVWAADGALPEVEAHYEPIGRIWRAVNEERAIGPAIVEDIYEHVAGTESRQKADYVSPIIMYIFPQLEGLRRDELERLIGDLADIVGDETAELWTVAEDFFQVDLQRTSGE